MPIDALRTTPLFSSLAEGDLERLLALAVPVSLREGELLIEEGTDGEALFVVVAGELEVTRHSAGDDLPIARVGRGALLGEVDALEGGNHTASARALGDVRALCIPRAALRELLASQPDAALAVIRSVTGRLRSTETRLRQREKLAGLGTLAAGLAHELINPASAIRRGVTSLGEALDARQRARAAVEEVGVSAGQLRAIRRMAPPNAPPRIDARARAGHADVMGSLLADLPLEDPHGTASTLAAAGWEPPALRDTLADLERRQAAAVVVWLAAGYTVDELLAEVRLAADRISEIVTAVKEYALDRAPIQRVDVRAGIDNTLLMLRHRLKPGIHVHREYAADLPRIEAYGSELNQVWTNLVDNAADAMRGRGELRIRARRAGDGGVLVTMCDSGPGIAADVLPHLFEPFFTTKPAGQGMGLGLHIAYSVVSRHGGRIEVTSEPGSTCFDVSLPAILERPAPEAAG
jgi:signal transduction histidine kinase